MDQVAPNKWHRLRADVLKLTQKELAEIAGVTKTAVWRWEHGVFEPSYSALERIREYGRQNVRKWHDSILFESAA